MADRIIDGYMGQNHERLPIKAKDNEDGTYSISTSIDGVTTEDGALNVYVKELRTNAVNQEFHQETNIFTTFSSPVTSQDRVLNVADTTGFNVGDTVAIVNGIVEPNYPTILEINGNTVTIDRPIDRSYGLTDGIRKVIINLAVDGSTTPQAFRITGEQSLNITHITRVLFEMTHSAGGDLGKFGGIPSLEKGVVIRAFRGDLGFWKTITKWRNNADIKRDMFDVEFDQRSGGQGEFGTSGRITFTKFGMVGEYDPNRGDFLEVMIQDDLTGLESFKINAQGHTED